MYQSIKERCEALSNNFKEISAERQTILENISTYIKQKIASKQSVQLNFICTHNSRRSHLGQVWAAVAADYYSISNVHTYSGGTEATAFNINAINALKNAGFIIKAQENTSNPVFEVSFGENKKSLCFSKTFGNSANPQSNFVAIMTCSDADDNCPHINGCELRIGTTYNDPKAYDGTSLQNEKYTERSNQIAMECLYIFSKINTL